MKIRKLIFILLSISFAAFAEDEPIFKLIPTGRVLIDGALYASPQKELFPDGLAIPEARIGVKMSYGKWFTWIDAGVAYGKIGLRNMWVQYNFNDHSYISAGNTILQYGLQSTSMSSKSTMEPPLASVPFTPGLQLGIMYSWHSPSFYVAASFNSESNALTNIMNYPVFNQQGYGLLTRVVGRNKNAGKDGNPIFHAGLSGGFLTPQQHLIDGEDIHEGFALSAIFPTRVTQLQAVGATIGNSKNLFKFTPELLIANGRLALEAQYFFQQINRRYDFTRYQSQGGYVTLHGILFGEHFGYNSAAAQLANPRKNSLECVVDYNYVTLSDPKARIFGGRANSFNITFNYYFNPYITARLNYSYTHTWNRQNYDPITLNAFQIRLMALF